MRLLVWILRALVFFTLFAFALNNEQPAVVNGFFGTQWRAPMVIIVIAAFSAGAVFGVLAMVPGWWRERWRRRAAQAVSAADKRPAEQPAATSAPAPGLDGLPREGL